MGKDTNYTCVKMKRAKGWSVKVYDAEKYQFVDGVPSNLTFEVVWQKEIMGGRESVEMRLKLNNFGLQSCHEMRVFLGLNSFSSFSNTVVLELT